MSGIVTKAIKSCIRRGKRVKVAQRYLRMKYNIKMGDNAFKKRVQYINQKN